MGDISAEPSMEEILSSIKRIIAEEGEPPSRTRRASRPAPTPPPTPTAITPDEPGVLELNDPVTPPQQPASMLQAPLAPVSTSQPLAGSPVAETASDDSPAQPTAESILSREAAAASRGKLDMLSRLVTKPEPGSDGTLEGLVREMLRPMLREWLDTNLPPMVEQMVAREIGKITGQI
ncbi:DUF2497 domain-containing protein [Sphingomonas aerophila]|uniref:DUF2497 domain-containing protein n=1 Tax=Sphingomonas aerophila TaxID=1344948 RepID=A0A7W9EU01_9SPHN|nr:DUF2497 domain-containing protein [Sphingomonas aerophila]MBB5714739.1 hypothetical protein [Sphingomonas aerophila]